MDRERHPNDNQGTYEPINTDNRSPSKLARDLIQVIQETVFNKKLDTPKRCPLVKQESDLTSSDDEDSNDRIANLIDFFFTLIKSQSQRKGSGGSCFKSETCPSEKVDTYVPKINIELEQKMETLIEFLATTGCMEKEEDKSKNDKKITLMEFLFGPEDCEKQIIEVNVELEINKGMSLTESKINVKDLSFIDDTPDEQAETTLVEMLIKYMENYANRDKKELKSISITPSLSEKSKSDVTINKLESFSDISKTKSDSTLTQTTVIDKFEDKSDKSSRRISETVVDLSNIKQDLEDIFNTAVEKICEIKQLGENDTMSEKEDLENFNSYTKPIDYPYYPYSVELSDIMEEDEPVSWFDRKSSIDDRMVFIRHCAEDIIKYIEEKIQTLFEDTSNSEEEFYIASNLKRSSVSLIDLRNIPDLPPSQIIKPKVIKVDKSTSTDSISEISRRIDSSCITMTTDTSSSSDKSGRALEKIESLHRFFSISLHRLEIIDESLEENGDRKSPKQIFLDSVSSDAGQSEYKAGQASLDDVEDIQADTEGKLDYFIKKHSIDSLNKLNTEFDHRQTVDERIDSIDSNKYNYDTKQ